MVEGRYAHRFGKPGPLKQYETDELGAYAYVHWDGSDPLWRFRNMDCTIEAVGDECADMTEFKELVRVQLSQRVVMIHH